jgi:hypothetical protein
LPVPSWALGAVKLLVHLALARRYGYFRDELYFLACGRHLDWGYVAHSPMIGLVVCRGLRTPLQEMWPRLKHWN